MNKRRSQIFVLALLVLVISYGVWATQVTVTTIKGPYPGTVSADDLDVTWTGVTSGIAEVTFTITGKEIALVYNATDEASCTVDFTSVADNMGRTGHITSYALGPGELAAFKFSNTVGWATSDRIVHASASVSCASFALLRY